MTFYVDLSSSSDFHIVDHSRHNNSTDGGLSSLVTYQIYTCPEIIMPIDKRMRSADRRKSPRPSSAPDLVFRETKRTSFL